MVVVVADSIPPAIHGRMKLWFIKPKANVFVSGVKDSVAKGVVDYLYDNNTLNGFIPNKKSHEKWLKLLCENWNSFLKNYSYGGKIKVHCNHRTRK